MTTDNDQCVLWQQYGGRTNIPLLTKHNQAGKVILTFLGGGLEYNKYGVFFFNIYLSWISMAISDIKFLFIK